MSPLYRHRDPGNRNYAGWAAGADRRVCCPGRRNHRGEPDQGPHGIYGGLRVRTDEDAGHRPGQAGGGGLLPRQGLRPHGGDGAQVWQGHYPIFEAAVRPGHRGKRLRRHLHCPGRACGVHRPGGTEAALGGKGQHEPDSDPGGGRVDRP